MAKTKVLICVKTYPTLSEKYDELVCTAGLREDGSWIRIYPVPFRKLNYSKQYSKWQWIELDLTRKSNDFRPESYRPNLDAPIKLLDKVGTENSWAERKKIVLHNVKTNMTELIKEAKDPAKRTSLAILKPTKVLDFICKESSREWDQSKLEAMKAHHNQLDLFTQEEAYEIFKVVKKIPYNFYYVFKTEDGKKRELMIEDWEIGMLYLNTLKKADGDERIACQKVRERFFDDFANKKDLYFFMGTTLKHHNVSRNPFIIIGTFYPPKVKDPDPSLF
ncbi:MAG: hypothetical protein J6T04_08685 [Bacteroidales bacterium]|nr:hypothetical protein [Bacteroidales bacterium]